MDTDVLVAGGGIAGLAGALGAARAGLSVRLFEQTARLAEVGAGLQLGPNAVRVLADWGLLDALRDVAAFPDALVVRDAPGGAELGRLRLGNRAQARYGQPYATVHRADLHALLWQAVAAQPEVELGLGRTVLGWQASEDKVVAQLTDNATASGHLLLGCDGLWSRVRTPLLGDELPVPTGHIAYRGLVDQSGLPPAQRQRDVVAWLGPRMHAVCYPVRRGEHLNVVVIVQGRLDGDVQNWSHAADPADLRAAMGRVAPALESVLQAVPQWLRWPLFERPVITGPQAHGGGRVALLGDAAHPMRPYLAQGAAMALEDAWGLGRLLAGQAGALAAPAGLLRQWADQRWSRNAWVQARSRRNGRIFHLVPPLSWGRNLAMAVLGERLLDVPALYSGPPSA
ncbi:FAD-dependent monooxygenase [Hydrogenophaga atypica]|uniref:FAD-dependent monooxygenase n=1 Tax=Hydrogenophaga atypica TaxID=249409 RepID=A0ABW2QK07_9BURK